MARRISSHVITPFALAAAAVVLFAVTARPAAAADPNSLDDQLQLNTSITAAGPDIHLGDLFAGYLSRPEKVVAQAPRPGQRIVLSAEWLSKLAHTYGLNWQPTSGYDRAVIYQPGQVVAAPDIIAAVKSDLIAKGMPANYSISPSTPLPAITVAAGTPVSVGVREAYFDAQSKTFSAVAEVPPGTADAQFVSLHGAVHAVVVVPVLKDGTAKNTAITSTMLTMVELPEDQMRPDTITDVGMLVGKAPKGFVRAGVPIRESEISQMTLVEIPVLNTDIRRDGTIAESTIVYATFNTADLPSDVVTDSHQLVGRTPRRSLSAGAPLRRGDVQMVRQVQVPVAARDLNRGELLDAKDITWVTMNDSTVVANVLTDEADIIGRQTKHPIRAGQTLRGFDILRPVAVERGKLVTILWSTPLMNLTVQGLAQESGGVGDVIRIVNTKSKTSVMAEVVDTQTVRITAQQTASR